MSMVSTNVSVRHKREGPMERSTRAALAHASKEEKEEVSMRKAFGMEWMSLPMAREGSSREGSKGTAREVVVRGIPSSGLHVRAQGGESKPSGTRERSSGYTVGDGGASWRAKKQRSGNGTMDGVGSGKEEVRAMHAMSHRDAYRERRKQSSSFGQRRDYLEDARTERGKLLAQRKRPQAEASMTWKQRTTNSEAASAHEPRNEIPRSSAQPSKSGSGVDGDRRDFHATQGNSHEDSVRRELAKGTHVIASTNNQTAAAMLRAKLLGKHKETVEGKEKPEPVHLPLVDARGMAVPGAFGRPSGITKEVETGGKPRKLERYEQGSGEKKRYFRDDDGATLNELVKKERFGGEDYDRNYARNLMANSRHKRAAYDVDAEYEFDEGLEMYESRSKTRRRDDMERHSRERQIEDYKRLTSIQDRCTFCFDNPKKNRISILAIGQLTYLKLPDRGKLVPGHCLIVPMSHCSSLRSVDENVATEIRNFQKCLIQMFAQEGKRVIFMETAVDLARQRRHAYMECVPVDEEAYLDAPLLFKREIDEAESEWSQHNAKKLIDTSTKGLRGSIPPDFPYFNVEFSLSGGYVHVIDDESHFNVHLGRDVMVSLLGLPEERMHQKSRRVKDDSLSAEASLFLEKWSPFDWTKQLD